jgi:hypothetical protein
MRRRATRIFTALAAISMGAFAMWNGWNIVNFVGARGERVSGESRASAVRPWTGSTGLAGVALEAALTDAVGPADVAAVRQRAEDLSAILSVRPLSSTTWLSLAGMRLVGGEPFANVLGALEMSSLTGANEGPLMLQRGIFGLLQWENLPSEYRSRIVGDLAGAIRETTVRDAEIDPARKLLATKANQTQREIADLLRAAGVPPKELARMGL